MANILKKIFTPSVDEVTQNYTIESWHISQSIDALTGTEAYDLTISGSLVVTGSVSVNGLTTTTQTGVVTIDTTTGQLFYTASSAFAVNNFYTSSISQSITSSIVNNNVSNSTVNQTIISSSVNTPAPSNQSIQYNSGSTFGASADFQFIYTSSSLQQGLGVIASGGYSHAQGKSTRATGNTSHAEGNVSLASGEFSHAEGFSTTASAEYSHAEGNSTKATGYTHTHTQHTGIRRGATQES